MNVIIIIIIIVVVDYHTAWSHALVSPGFFFLLTNQ